MNPPVRSDSWTGGHSEATKGLYVSWVFFVILRILWLSVPSKYPDVGINGRLTLLIFAKY
jgi:hypothetical protein